MITDQLIDEDNIVLEFANWLELEAMSAHTLTAYSADTKKLVRHLKLKGVPLDGINGQMVIDSILGSENAKKGISRSTIRRKINSASTFVKFLNVLEPKVKPLKPSRLEKIAFSRVADEGIGLREKTNSCIINDDGFDKLIEAICHKPYYFSSPDYYRARDVLLANLFYRAGARVDEAVNLKIGDMIIGQNKFLVTLGEKRRAVEFDVKSEGGAYPVVAYRKFLAEFMRIEDEIDPETPAILSRSRRAITARSIRRHFEAYGQDAYGSPISPRGLRISHMVYLIDSGKPVGKIAQRLGVSPITVAKRDYT